MNSIIVKLIDNELVPLIGKAVTPNSSKHQFGFKKGVSCTNAGVLLTDALMEAKESRSPIYM